MTPDKETLDAFAAVPANRHLGFVLESQSPADATVRLEPHGDFVQETGVVHGGILATLADTTAVYALLGGMVHGQAMASIEMNVNFLSPAHADRGSLLSHAVVLRRGRRVAVCEVEISQRGVLVAKGLFTYHLFEGGIPSR